MCFLCVCWIQIFVVSESSKEIQNSRVGCCVGFLCWHFHSALFFTALLRRFPFDVVKMVFTFWKLQKSLIFSWEIIEIADLFLGNYRSTLHIY